MTKNRRHDIVKPSKFKTSMCTFYVSEEGCPFGDKCAFAHGKEELRAEPQEGAAAASTGQTETAAATSSPTSSHASENEMGASGTAGKNSSRHSHDNANTHGNQNSSGANAKRKAKKNRMDASTNAVAVSGNTHNIPGGKSNATLARFRPQRDRRPLPLSMPLQSPGSVPAAAYNLSVAPPAPTAYTVYGELSMAYSGIPAVPSMPCYIPTVGNHPFSTINSNHHAINAAPHTQTAMPYAAAVPPPPQPQPTFSPSLPQPTSTPQGSLPISPMPLSQKINNKNVSSAGEESRRRSRQTMRHIVSSNTMAHTHDRRTSNTMSAPLAEVASPQYVCGLMASVGVPLTGSPMPTTAPAAMTAASLPTSEPRKSNENPAVSTPSQPQKQPFHPQQPRLIVVPHRSGSGGYVVPSNVRNYHPQTMVEPTSPVPLCIEGSTSTESHHNSAARTETTTTVAALDGAGDVAAALNSFRQLRASPVPPTVVHIPLNGLGSDLSNRSDGKVIGEALWGPAGGPMDPLTNSALPISDDGSNSNGRDYNALLSDLGIGGSSYTTIPLEELVFQRGPTRDDDDISVGGDFDWTAALERWLHATKEESAATSNAKSTVTPTVKEPTTTTTTVAVPQTLLTQTAPPNLVDLPQSTQPVTAALSHKPVLMEGGTRPKAPATSDGKRKPTLVCQVSRAGCKPSPPKRRAPVMTNQFKSSCAAEAESGSVLLYCAEKNTLVYITSMNAKTPPTVVAATNPNTNQTGSASSTNEASGPTPAAGAAVVKPNLGVDVRFNPGRKKRSVLALEGSDDDAEYCI